MFVRVCFRCAPVEKDTQKSFFCFSIQPCQNSALEENRSVLCLSVAYLLCFLYLLTKNETETRGKKKTMRESHVSVQKDGVNGVFYCLVFLLFFASGLPCLGTFRSVFSSSTSRLVQSILLPCLLLRPRLTVISHLSVILGH